MGRGKRNWKVAFAASKDQNEMLRRELLGAYRILATIAIDGRYEQVEKEFLAELAQMGLPYDARKVMRDIKEGDFKWWASSGHEGQTNTEEESG